MWATEGPQTRPPNGTLLADLGPGTKSGRQPLPALIVTADVDAHVILQHRSDDNGSNRSVQGFPVGANQPLVLPGALGHTEVQPGERFRVVTLGTINGIIQASLMDGL